MANGLIIWAGCCFLESFSIVANLIQSSAYKIPSKQFDNGGHEKRQIRKDDSQQENVARFAVRSRRSRMIVNAMDTLRGIPMKQQNNFEIIIRKV